MGGELPALVISEAVMRLRPGILGKDESADKESFTENLLEYPQYTKPEKWVKILDRVWSTTHTPTKAKQILTVPKVLLTGHQ